RNRPPRLRSVRQTRRIPQKRVARIGNVPQQRAQHRQPAKARIENPNVWRLPGNRHGFVTSAPAAPEVRYVLVKSACPASDSLTCPSTRKRTSVTRGRLACSVSLIDSTVSVSVSRPDGWLAAKLPLRLITASSSPESFCAAAFAEFPRAGSRNTCSTEAAPPGTG